MASAGLTKQGALCHNQSRGPVPQPNAGPCATTNRGALFRLAAHIPAEPFGKNFLSMV